MAHYQRCNTYVEPIPVQEGEERPPIPENETEEQRIERYEREGDYITNIGMEPVRRDEEIVMFIHRIGQNNIVECYTIDDINNLRGMIRNRFNFTLPHTNIIINRQIFDERFNRGERTFLIRNNNIINIDRHNYFVNGEIPPLENNNEENVRNEELDINELIGHAYLRLLDIEGDDEEQQFLRDPRTIFLDGLINANDINDRETIDNLLNEGQGDELCLESAIRFGNNHVANILINRGLARNRHLFLALITQNDEIINSLLDRGLGHVVILNVARLIADDNIVRRLEEQIVERNNILLRHIEDDNQREIIPAHQNPLRNEEPDNMIEWRREYHNRQRRIRNEQQRVRDMIDDEENRIGYRNMPTNEQLLNAVRQDDNERFLQLANSVMGTPHILTEAIRRNNRVVIDFLIGRGVGAPVNIAAAIGRNNYALNALLDAGVTAAPETVDRLREFNYDVQTINKLIFNIEQRHLEEVNRHVRENDE